MYFFDFESSRTYKFRKKMTIHADLLKVWKSFLLSHPKSPFIETYQHGENPSEAPPPPQTHTDKKRIAIIDVPLVFFYRLGYECPTLEEFWSRMARKCEILLKDDNVEAVVFCIDKQAPLCKYVSDSRTSDDNTPTTPLDGDDIIFSLATLQQRMEAWWQWFIRNPNQTDDKLMSEGASSMAVQNDDYKLPPTFNAQDRSLPGFPKDQKELKDYYKNKDFKELLYRKCCQGVYRLVNVPEGKWILVTGPSFCQLKPQPREGNHISKALKVEFREADTTVGYFAKIFAAHHNVDIFSEDGDSIICALLASNLRIAKPPDHLEDVSFRNCVRVIRNQWNEKVDVTAYNINNLYLSVHLTFSGISMDIKQCIGTFCALSMLAKNDYIPGLSQITPKTIFEVYTKHYAAIGTQFVSNFFKAPRGVWIDIDAFKRFVALCYATKYKTHFPSQPLNTVTLAHCVETMYAKKLAPTRASKTKAAISVSNVEVIHANLIYCMNYFVSSAFGNVWSINEFDVSDSGKSLFGYRKNDVHPDQTGHWDVAYTEEVDTEELHKFIMKLNKITV